MEAELSSVYVIFCLNYLSMQANVTRTNHIMWTMGDDFKYQYAESWFKQMDKLIHYVNKVDFNPKNFIYGILVLKLQAEILFLVILLYLICI